MSLFTRGPWVAEKTGRGIGPVSEEPGQSYAMVIPVAWVEFNPEMEVQVANANLIAAAPELIEALQAMVSTRPPAADTVELRLARAAIAKALGG